MPDWAGWKGADAVQLLEKHGYRVEVRGNGRVRSWSAGSGRKSITLVLG